MITLSVAFMVGTFSIHLVKYSVEVRNHLCCPLEGGFISPLNSNPHCLKGPLEVMGFRGSESNFYFLGNF
jgi:hypothetical protein